MKNITKVIIAVTTVAAATEYIVRRKTGFSIVENLKDIIDRRIDSIQDQSSDIEDIDEDDEPIEKDDPIAKEEDEPVANVSATNEEDEISEPLSPAEDITNKKYVDNVDNVDNIYDAINILSQESSDPFIPDINGDK